MLSLNLSLRSGHKYPRTGSESDSGDFSTPNSEEDEKKMLQTGSAASNTTFNIANAIKIIPEFDGSYKDYSRFLQICNKQFSKAVTPVDKSEFLDIVKSKLCGKAYNVIRGEEYNDWKELEKALNKHFQKYRSPQVVQSELFSIKQGPRETVSSYAGKIEALLEELNLSTTQNLDNPGIKAIRNLNEVTALNNFKRGLRHPLKMIVKSTKHNTLTEAVDFACEEEQVLECDTRPSEPKRCGYCKNVGHTFAECRKRMNSSNKPVNNFPKFPPVNRLNTVRAIPTCNYCKSPGHVIDQCRKRQYNNARRENFKTDKRAQSSNTNYKNSANKNRNFHDNPSGNLNAPEVRGTTIRVQDL